MRQETKMNTTSRTPINPRELCSRKLWQLVSAADGGNTSAAELAEAVAELAERRHYLEQLRELGKLGEPNRH